VPRSEDELLTDRELSEELKVSQRTLQRWRALGIGPKVLRVGPRRSPRYRWADVQRWLEATAGPTEDRPEGG
jgi:predicted DNA-binding transcriptional regulator AlpA